MDEKDDFLRLARSKGILTEDRLRQCAAEWEGLGGAASGKHLWDVALERKFLTPKAHARVAEHMGFIALREEDKVRGDAAVRAGLLKAADLDVALFLQRKSYKDRREIKRLEEYLLGMGALLVDQIQAFRKAEAPPPPAPGTPAAPAEESSPPTRAAVLLNDELTLDNPELLQKYLAEEAALGTASPDGTFGDLDEDLAVVEPISSPEDLSPGNVISEFDDEETFLPPDGEGPKK